MFVAVFLVEMQWGQVLYEKFLWKRSICLIPERGLVQDTGNGDGYVTLRTSSLFVSNDTLNNAFALGVLCAFFMLKCHSGPDPVSPALIQAAIGGVDSIVDSEWLEAINPDVAKKLAILPADPNVPIPEDNQSLRILIASKMSNFRVSTFIINSFMTLPYHDTVLRHAPDIQ